jgi:hypothetical protein
MPTEIKKTITVANAAGTTTQDNTVVTAVSTVIGFLLLALTACAMIMYFHYNRYKREKHREEAKRLAALEKVSPQNYFIVISRHLSVSRTS